MAIDTTYSAARRRNVSPKSSTLNVQVRDVDCSDLTYVPEDGEFITLSGSDLTAPTEILHASSHAGLGSTTDAEAMQLRMVWGSARRSDRAALSEKRVPVLMHGPGIDIDTCLYNADSAETLATNFPVGTLLSVADNINVLTNVSGGAVNVRMVLEAFSADDCGWAVGYVREEASGDPGNDNPIHVHIFGTPRFVGSSD